jgi:ssDNA-binding replication factor A large subunit
LLASKVSIGITVNFQDESDISVGSGFTLEIETGGFSDTSIDYTSDRNVDVSAVLGECASPGNYGPYSIGSMLKFCVKSNDFDVVISGFSGVSFKDSDGNSILGIVDDSGEPSFLTTVAGLDSKSVDVATMMATTIFDQGYGGKTINVQGNVSVTYIDQTISSRRRQLQREESQPFALQLVVGEDSSEQGVLSSFPAISNGVIGAVVAVLAIGGLVLISSLV